MPAAGQITFGFMRSSRAFAEPQHASESRLPCSMSALHTSYADSYFAAKTRERTGKVRSPSIVCLIPFLHRLRNVLFFFFHAVTTQQVRQALREC